MGNLIADIFVTVRPIESRRELTSRSMRSLLENTDRDQFRLTVCLDGLSEYANSPYSWSADYVLSSRDNEGLGPTINRAIAHIKSVNDWHSQGDSTRVAPFVVCCQDDCEYEPGWLGQLASRFIAYERLHSLGFATGHEAVEHAHTIRKHLGERLQLQDWVRMTNLLGRREYWESLMPISRIDPETGRLRAKPNDGMGSSCDWWLLRNHPNSVCKTGRTNLVIPGLVRHIGFNHSTWLGRPLPESDADKSLMDER